MKSASGFRVYFKLTRVNGCHVCVCFFNTLLNKLVHIFQSDQHDHVSRICENGQIAKYMFEDAKTVYEGFRRGARESKNGECLGYRKQMPDGTMPYVWLRYDEVIKKAEFLARGFLDKGLAVGQQTFVGIYSTNRPEVRKNEVFRKRGV